MLASSTQPATSNHNQDPLIPTEEVIRERRIARGTFAVVYEGTWGNKQVAIKKFTPIYGEKIQYFRIFFLLKVGS